MDILINYLLKKQIIKLSSIENSFFVYKKLDKKIKLTPQIVALNYASESPYISKSIISSIIDGENLYLWFIKGEKVRYLSEAQIIFRRLLEKYKNVICIIEGNPNKIIVIKKGHLVASFAKNIISLNDKKILESKYTINKFISLKEDIYRDYLKESYKFLTFSDILNILDIKIDIHEVLKKSVSFFALPLLISSIVVTMLLAGYSFYLDTQRDILFKEFKKMQKSNAQVKRLIVKNEKENRIYQELLNEFKYVDKTIALSQILKVTNDLNMTIVYIKIYDKNVDFIVKTSNSSNIPIYVKRLFKTNQFRDVKNINSRKVRGAGIEVTMSAKLKEIS
jgi:hypothetical protein